MVLFLTGSIVLTVAGFVLPASALAPGILTVLVPLAIAFGIAHLVAAYGILRRRPWSGRLTLYLMAVGLGVAAFGALLVATGVDPFARPGVAGTDQGRADVLGLLGWLIGSWLVAARFAVRAMAAPVGREREVTPLTAVAPIGAPARAMAQATFLVRPAAAR